MSDTNRENGGKVVLFHNPEANGDNRRPDFSGTITLNKDYKKGDELRVVVWHSGQTSRGNEYFSGRCDLDDNRNSGATKTGYDINNMVSSRGNSAPDSGAASAAEGLEEVLDDDDDIPF